MVPVSPEEKEAVRMFDDITEIAGQMLILDRTAHLEDVDALYPFAMDELLCRRTGEGGPPLCHIWRHPRSFIIGLRDSRLPGAQQARAWLKSLGYRTAIRNSGGAAVPLDPDVVNVSLILPKRGTGDLHFHRDFERMYALIRQALAATGQTVDKGEVVGAYCPGDYDLSIGGRKFCGIAQRRQAHAYVIQAFVIAGGSGRERGQLVKSFYDLAAAGAKDGDYPSVEPGTMASLDELTGMGPGAADMFAASVKEVVRSLQTAAGVAEAASRLHLPSEEEIREMTVKLTHRYTPRTP